MENTTIKSPFAARSFPLSNSAFERPRPIRLICIGAGLSGILNKRKWLVLEGLHTFKDPTFYGIQVLPHINPKAKHVKTWFSPVGYAAEVGGGVNRGLFRIFPSLVPDFPPGCRRLTPGSGYLRDLVRGQRHVCRRRHLQCHQ